MNERNRRPEHDYPIQTDDRRKGMTTKEQAKMSEIESVWNEFIGCGKVKSPLVRPEIKASWERCRTLGVDPENGNSHTILRESELADLLSKKKDLITVAMPFMERFYKQICDTGFGLMLGDENGFILKVLMTTEIEEVLKQASFNAKPGARWLEEDVGTNGYDLVLRHNKPFQIAGAEHYARLHHMFSCVGAPIFNVNNQLTGALIATGYAGTTHKHTVAMIRTAVEVISDEIMIKEKNTQLTIANNRLMNILMSMSDGVIVTDRFGSVTEINPVAMKIMGEQRDRIVSKGIDEYFNDGFIFRKNVLQEGFSYTDKEAKIRSKSQMINILATSNPIRDEQGNIVGGIVVLTPREKLRKLVKRYSSISARLHFEDIIGKSHALKVALRLAEKASQTSHNILLEGESGTGKEIFAQAIHNNSDRKDGPFVAINCGALPRELMASELFGYTEGSFTGAKKEGRPGKFELADGGTIFLDEVTEMPLDQQVNLLRVLQERRVTRIGSITEIPIDIMVICATNKNLQSEVLANNFRQDLYYRLNVISIKIPPLRDRPDDIPLLVNHFIEAMNEEKTKVKIKVSPEVIECFKRYSWPGNVRELQNVVEKMLLSCNGDYLSMAHIPSEIQQVPVMTTAAAYEPRSEMSFLNNTRQRKREASDKDEQGRIMMLLDQYGGNISKVAKELGINRVTVYKKMKRHNLV
jgi:transcriptional regulator of acetoin/glycerol metabolism